MNRKVMVGAVVVAVAAVAGFLLQRTLAERPTLVEEQISRADGTKNGANVNDARVGDASRTAGSHTAGSQPAGGMAAADGSANSTDAAPDHGDEHEDGEEAPRSRPIPETVPAIALPDRDGVTRQLSDWKGRPVIINFWATWCGPCRDEIPLLKTLRNERSRDRLEIVGIAIDQRDAVKRYARDIGIDYPILIGEKEGYAAAEAFGVSLVLPFSVFADSKGRIVTLKIGELHANEAAFILDRVRDVDTKRLELTAARQQIADELRTLAVERGKQNADAG